MKQFKLSSIAFILLISQSALAVGGGDGGGLGGEIVEVGQLRKLSLPKKAEITLIKSKEKKITKVNKKKK